MNPSRYKFSKQLIASGIQPDFLIARAEEPIDDRRKKTLAWTTNIPADHIISAPNVDSIYRVPVNFDKEGLADKILQQFGMPTKKKDMKKWYNLVTRITTTHEQAMPLQIAVVGKYFETGSYQLADVYVSVIESLKHASWANKAKIQLTWISSVKIEKDGAAKAARHTNAIVIF